MARRIRRPRVVWLPPTLANTVQLGPGEPGVGIRQLIVAPSGKTTVTGEVGVVIDAEDFPYDSATTSLSDIENSGYRLRRIVGKIFCICEQQQAGPSTLLVTAGLIVRRTLPATGVSLAASTNNALIDPNVNDNYGDPWIWRRSWILGNNISADKGTTDPVLPETNFGAFYGSAADGPHVDQKTARIVSSEERLFLDVSATDISNSTVVTTTGVLVTADLRVLASMRTSSGNRGNASR